MMNDLDVIIARVIEISFQNRTVLWLARCDKRKGVCSIQFTPMAYKASFPFIYVLSSLPCPTFSSSPPSNVLHIYYFYFCPLADHLAFSQLLNIISLAHLISCLTVILHPSFHFLPRHPQLSMSLSTSHLKAHLNPPHHSFIHPHRVSVLVIAFPVHATLS